MSTLRMLSIKVREQLQRHSLITSCTVEIYQQYVLCNASRDIRVQLCKWLITCMKEPISIMLELVFVEQVYISIARC